MTTTAAVHEPVSRPRVNRDYLSWSAGSTYLKCPLRYRFRYVDQIPEAFVSVSLVFGTAIHAALQAHFQELLNTGRVPGLEALTAAYHESWLGTDLSRVQFTRSDELHRLAVLAERMLTAFQSSSAAEAGGTILGVEEEVRSPVIAGCPDLLARLDLLVETDDALVVTDFKTSRARWLASDGEVAAGQLLVYHELVERFSEKPIRLRFAVLTKGKKPTVDVIEVRADSSRTLRIRGLIRRVWRAIQGGHFYPAPSAMQCPSCPFQTQCRAWTG
jgi:putative RecB family exonuclease